MHLNDWNAITAVATAASGFILLISAIVLAWQIYELRRATHAQAYATALDWLQNEEVRMARRKLFNLNVKEVTSWPEEDKLAAEKVCHTYDIVAIMVRNGMLPKETLMSWRDSLERSWKAAYPLIAQYRKDRLAPDLWDDFEWLAKQMERKKGCLQSMALD